VTSTAGTAPRTRCGRCGSTGIWELFIPHIGDGAIYKFQILGRDGAWREKADPFAFATEVPPATGVGRLHLRRTPGATTPGSAAAAQTDQHKRPMSVYEVHLGSLAGRPGLPPARRAS